MNTALQRKIILGIIAAALVLIAAAAVTSWWMRRPPAAPPYSPPPRDALAVSADDFPPDLPAINTGQYAVRLNPNMAVGADGQCAIMLVNPMENDCHFMLDVRLVDSGLLIYRTGLIAPGEGIREITFVPDARKAMTGGRQQASLTIHTFKRDTYENAGDVTLNVPLTYAQS